MQPSCRRVLRARDRDFDGKQGVGEKILEPMPRRPPPPEAEQREPLHAVRLPRGPRLPRRSTVLQSLLEVAAFDVQLGQPPRRRLGHRHLRRGRAVLLVRGQPGLQRAIGRVTVAEVVFVLVAAQQQRAALGRRRALERRRDGGHGATARPLEQRVRIRAVERARVLGGVEPHDGQMQRDDEVVRRQRRRALERGLCIRQPLLLGQRVREIQVDVRGVWAPAERLAQQPFGVEKVAAGERTLASREAASGAIERKVPPHAGQNRFYCRVAATKERPMTGFGEYERYDGLGLAELVARGDIAPEELMEAAIARVEARNPLVNAVTMKLYDFGRRAIAAGLPDGPFRGVPYL